MNKNKVSSEVGQGFEFLSRIFWFLASLKLAILILFGLALALTAGTLIESWYDTPTAQFWVYRAFWFRSLLGLLAINIFTVAVSRYPWKRRHIPFLLAHLGILILLFGAWLTDRVGLDGIMRITEGESTSTVEVDSPFLWVHEIHDTHENDSFHSIPLPWLPPGVPFKPFSLTSRGVPYDVKVDQFISHADPEFHFLPVTEDLKKLKTSHPAIHIKLVGGPMRISQDFWLWSGQPGWNAFQAGPAWLAMDTTEGMPAQGPRLILNSEKDGSVSYRAISSMNDREVKGRLVAGKVIGEKIATPWKGGISISVLEWVPDAQLETTYKSSRIQYRDMAPPPAIHLVAGKGGKNEEIWIGQGERAILQIGDQSVMLGYFRKQVMLPFSVSLERFNIERYEGTMNPSSYSSKVTILDGRQDASNQKSQVISMNEPLKVEGFTLYQASYEDAMPRPVTSVFSVNQDPGRPWKYLGSILLVLGSILLFAMKTRGKTRQRVSSLVNSDERHDTVPVTSQGSSGDRLEVNHV